MYTETPQHKVAFVYPLLKRHKCSICLFEMRSFQDPGSHLLVQRELGPLDLHTRTGERNGDGGHKIGL